MSGTATIANVTANTIFTLTCTNIKGSGSDSFNARILTTSLTAVPDIGMEPLNNVDLAASAGGTSVGTYRHFFDCTNDGAPDLDTGDIASSPYTAVDVCNYSTSGTYTAKVEVWHSEGVATATDIVTVAVQPVPTAQNLSVSAADYCLPPPSQRFSWNFNDPEDGANQSAYWLVIDNNSNFSSPEFDSGKLASIVTSPSVVVSSSPGANQLAFNTTYYWRVTVYDSQDRSSGWVNGTSFATAIHLFPDADFNWSPTSPTKEDAVLFSDTTIFHTGSRNQSWFWSVPGATYLASTNDSTQNPQVRFKAKGTYLVSLFASDDAGTCVKSRSVIVGLPIPEFEEVAP